MKNKFLFIVIGIEFLVIIFVWLASFFSEIGFAIFYNLLYGIVLSLLVPILFLLKNKQGFETMGIKKLKMRQYTVMLSFILLSVGGQTIPLIIKNIPVKLDLLPIAFLPLIMTTFFEEFLFRGFIQTRIEKQYGYIFAILLSGLFFSLYHIGYQGFRTFSDLSLLFAVGIGFAVAYKLSDNNLIVSYFVNLPNAFVTYILKSDQFPIFTKLSSVFAGITIILIIIILVFTSKKLNFKTTVATNSL